MFDLVDRLKFWIDGLDLDFCRWRYYAMGISGALVALSWVLFFTVQPNYGTDFTGGTEIHLRFSDPIEIGDLRAGLRKLGLEDDSVQAVGGSDSGEFAIRIADPEFGMKGLADEMRAALAKQYGDTWVASMTASAEVSARFVVEYTGAPIDYATITRDLQAAFPGARALPGRDDLQVAIEVPGLGERIKDLIAVEMGGRAFTVLSTDSVGPKVGGDLRRQAFVAMAATVALILVYVAFRFDIEYAPGAIIAVLHDVSLTVGVFVVFQLDFNLATVGALLTLLGWGLNDTIVIYDRIRENQDRYRRTDTVTLINKSVSETLTRTVATNFAVLLAVASFFIWGGPMLRDFGIAMMCGLVFGTYSTVYIASPIIIIVEDLKPYLQRLLVVSDSSGDGGPASGGDDSGEPGTGPTVTESEKRRRSRADADKKELLG